jgi:hypothetical protein
MTRKKQRMKMAKLEDILSPSFSVKSILSMSGWLLADWEKYRPISSVR